MKNKNTNREERKEVVSEILHEMFVKSRLHQQILYSGWSDKILSALDKLDKGGEKLVNSIDQVAASEGLRDADDIDKSIQKPQNFQAGDTIRMRKWHGGLDRGYEGIVKANEYGLYVGDSKNNCYHQEYWQLIKEPQKFEVGDRIRMKEDCCELKKGEECVVKTGIHSLYVDDGNDGCHEQDNWQLISKAQNPAEIEKLGISNFHWSIVRPKIDEIIEFLNNKFFH